MRITQSMYYKNIYGENNSQLNKKLFDVNKQIASGVKIQYAYDDIRTFTDTMRLDNEISILGQIKNSSDNGYKISDQSDVILTEFQDKLADIKPLMIKAANDTNSEESRDSIAKELRAIESNLKDLANSSINGKYLFSGSALDVKPISENGIYMGNDTDLNAFTGKNISQRFNISGAELFLGNDSSRSRMVVSNVVQSPNVGTTLDGSTTMADYNGTIPAGNLHNFYLRGTKSDGTSFKTPIQLLNTDTIDNLLTKIGQAYGNGAVDLVNVSMNSRGQISIEDKIKGSSKLEFHMIGASDFNAIDSASGITDMDILDAETTDYLTASGAPGDIFVREFMQSSLTPAAGAATLIEGIVYDRTAFSVNGTKLSSSVPQVLKETNAFASASTKISEVADLSQLPTAGSLNGTTLNLEGTNTGGGAYTATINLLSTGSTFTVNGDTYSIFNMETPRVAVNADKMTYQQLMDVINMTVTGNLPGSIPGTESEYDAAIESSHTLGITSLSYDGKIEFNDLLTTSTKARIAMYDSNSDDFTNPASVMTFNTNNALIVNDPKTDFFKALDEIITSVEEYKNNPDASVGSVRNIGIDNSLALLEELVDHIGSAHSTVGAQSNALTTSIERTTLLELSTNTLRSSVIDTDLAEASLTLTQLSLNYEAMLSTVGKISQLSLVNYL